MQYNLKIMHQIGAGGYRFKDYLKVGLPLYFKFDFFREMSEEGRLEYRFADVRETIPDSFFNEEYDLIANFAALNQVNE